MVGPPPRRREARTCTPHEIAQRYERPLRAAHPIGAGLGRVICAGAKAVIARTIRGKSGAGRPCAHDQWEPGVNPVRATSGRTRRQLCARDQRENPAATLGAR